MSICATFDRLILYIFFFHFGGFKCIFNRVIQSFMLLIYFSVGGFGSSKHLTLTMLTFLRTEAVLLVFPYYIDNKTIKRLKQNSPILVLSLLPSDLKSF